MEFREFIVYYWQAPSLLLQLATPIVILQEDKDGTRDFESPL